MKNNLLIHPEVADALTENRPVVALESTVTAHGLPYPENLQTAGKLEEIVRENGAVPATIAVLAGIPHIGLSASQLEQLAVDKSFRKISRRDLALAVSQKWNAATTVATTLFFAHRAGIKVFATGGIGGVHRGFAADISADLPELANTPLTVVCSGAKIVLDLPATREWLETNGITVLGFQCDEMPAFYSRQSGLPVDLRVENAGQVAGIIQARDELNLKSAILLTVPVPKEDEVPQEKLEQVLTESLREAAEKQISGRNVTPFLLSKMAQTSDGATLRANIALLKNNARVAAAVAVGSGQ
jgi:pseudouridine-5'-phosphate glycosidase